VRAIGECYSVTARSCVISYYRCAMVASQQRRKHESRGMPTVRNSYLATPGEAIEAVMFGVVICRMCRIVKLL
jgi:hypothetical protein